MPASEGPAFGSAFDALDIGVAVVDQDGRVIAWNDWLASASGIDPASAIGRDLAALFPNARLGRLTTIVAQALASGASGLMTHALHPALLPLRTRAGRPMTHNVSVRPIGERPYAACLLQITDVTVSVLRERVLRERQNARYDAVFFSASDVILTLDSEGVIQMANPAAAREFGYAPEELVGQPSGMLFGDDEIWRGAWDEVLSEGALKRAIEIVARRKDGSASYVEISAARWASDSRTFVTAILHDVNERRTAEETLRRLNETLEARVLEELNERGVIEEALRQSQKMEVIGQLTGGIAHDFNNLLTGILGAMDIMKRRLAARKYEDLPRFMDAASASANRAASLTHRLLAFARRQPLDPKAVNPNLLIQGMEELLRRTLGERVRLHTELEPDLWLALSDANQLENAVLNLAINARDAMAEGGRLTVTTRNITVLEAVEHGQERVEPGDYIVICVSDTGEGMSPETITKVFEPFFTTKPIGEGTGLGLSMIYGFAKQSRGHVLIDSRLGEGTEVKLYLPRYHGVITSTEGPVGDAPPGSGEAVLLVEDDSSVRLLIGEVLRDLGYACMEAGDSQAALPIINSNARIDLMITDVGLPGLNGRQLADIARMHRPSLKILFVTGYAEHATGPGGFLEPGMAMVTKPFALDALALKIRDIIGSA
jgi:PAS domain S-box-containing protein